MEATATVSEKRSKSPPCEELKSQFDAGVVVTDICIAEVTDICTAEVIDGKPPCEELETHFDAAVVVTDICTAEVIDSLPKESTGAGVLDAKDIHSTMVSSAAFHSDGIRLVVDLPITKPQEADAVEEAINEPQQADAVEEATNEPQQADVVEEATKEPQQADVVKDATNEPQQADVLKDATNEPQQTDVLEEATNEPSWGDVEEPPVEAPRPPFIKRPRPPPENEAVDDVVQTMRNILMDLRNADDARLKPEDEEKVRSVLEHHPAATEKMGSGIDHIKIKRHSAFKESRCFWVVRTDGSETDFSYHKCLKHKIAKEHPDFIDRYDAIYRTPKRARQA